MFSALVLACAVYSGDVSNVCAEFKDTWGPYNTVENCSIRTEQMVDFLSAEREFVFQSLGNPEDIVFVEFCNETEGELL